VGGFQGIGKWVVCKVSKVTMGDAGGDQMLFLIQNQQCKITH